MRIKTYALATLSIVTMAASPALAQIELDSYFTGTDSVVPDGDLDEWADENGKDIVTFMPLVEEDRVAGEGNWEGPEDISGSLALAHNTQALFASFKVKDQRLIRNKKPTVLEDHIQIWIAIPSKKGGFSIAGVGIYADPSRYKGPVEMRRLKPGAKKAGGAIKGAKGGATGNEWSYTIEVAIPWKSILGKNADLTGMRVAVYYVDVDMAAHPIQKSILGTAPVESIDTPGELPLVLMGDLGAGVNAFNDTMGLPTSMTGKFITAANITGGKEKEDVQVLDRYLLAQGGAIGGPSEYVYTELPVTSDDQVTMLKAKDITGDKKHEIIVEFEKEVGVNKRRWVEIYEVNNDRAFQKIFWAALLVENGTVSITNQYKIKGGKKKTIEVTAGKVTGADEESFEGMAPSEDGNPMVLPWDKPAKKKYKLQAGQYFAD